MRARQLCLALGAAALAMTTGCASIVTGQNQPVSVQTRASFAPVSGAECEITNDKGKWFVVTPGSTMVTRSYEDLHVVCSRDGYEPGAATVKSATKGMAFGNILLGGIIGAAVDAGSGAAYDYPSLITVRMTQIVNAAPEPPAVSTPIPAAPSVAPPAAVSAPPAPARRTSTGLPPGTMILGPR